MNPFRRSRALEEQLGVDVGEVDGYVPSSAKAPEWQRFAPVRLDDVDEDDQDVAFLASLTAQVEQGGEERAAEPARRGQLEHAPAPRTGADDLQVFRAFAHETPAESVLSHIRVQDVEIAELLDELQTMRAAIRQKRAA